MPNRAEAPFLMTTAAEFLHGAPTAYATAVAFSRQVYDGVNLAGSMCLASTWTVTQRSRCARHERAVRIRRARGADAERILRRARPERKRWQVN